ncbi:MAG: PAS domain S-box protein [Deltaproteobacteria bacterium]|nr:MAG: PAS domain S-box protein [Deltaproteobacteria bacterium]
MDAALDPRYVDLIFDHIPHGIFTVDAGRRITAFNPTAEQITGFRQEEVIGQECWRVFRSSHCERRCFLQRSMDVGEAHRDREVEIVRRDGQRLAVAVSTAALSDGSHILGGVEMFRDLSEVRALRQRLAGTYHTGDIISKSAAMRPVRELVPLLARSDSSVLIQGETGTGKELVARAIHSLGPRAKHAFVAVNCGAIPETLVESELFGHVRGAFTGAHSDRVGRFAMAQGGTLLLDEIGDVAPSVQVKLLRVLQERQFTPVGSSRSVTADVRVIAATNRDLAAEAARGRFRRDLLYRLDVVTLTLPPLRDRPEDIPLLVDHFVSRFNALQRRGILGVSGSAMARLMAYRFPGNVRELENIIEHAFVVCEGDVIRASDLPPSVHGGATAVLPSPLEVPRPPADAAALGPLESAEAAAIRQALNAHGGSRADAAQALGISRSTLWRKMRRFGISDPAWGDG